MFQVASAITTPASGNVSLRLQVMSPLAGTVKVTAW